MLSFHLKLHFLGGGVFHSGLPLPLSAPCTDNLQDPEEEVALASLSPNGNCEEAAGGTGT